MAVTRRMVGDQKEKNEDKPQPSSSNESVQSDSGSKISKILLISLVIIGACYYYHRMYLSDLHALVTSRETVTKREFIIPCSNDYKSEVDRFRGCTPTKCGRFVKDDIVTPEEADRLLKLAKTGMAFGGSSGGATILDLHSGALSKGDKFINIYKLVQSREDPVFEEADFVLYRNTKNRIKKEIAETFDIPVAKLHLTKPTFFSRMNTKPAVSLHDEYWHPHVDKETYGSFHYTSLLYLSTYGSDFTGGRFVFVDKPDNRTLHPKKGRLSFFTSGSENVHFVEKLEWGTRYAITVSFTCDPDQKIADPRLPPSKPKSTRKPGKPPAQ